MNATQSRRRTRKDLEYLADAAKDSRPFAVVDPDQADDADRNTRLQSHGWFTAQGKFTANGERIAQVVRRLRTAREFEWAVDIFGVGGFADIATDAAGVDDAVDVFRTVFSAANLCDEARHQADTQDDEPDHDGLFEPHIDAVDARLGSIDLVFDVDDTAAEFVDLWNTETRKSSTAVRSAADPNRVVIGVGA